MTPIFHIELLSVDEQIINALVCFKHQRPWLLSAFMHHPTQFSANIFGNIYTIYILLSTVRGCFWDISTRLPTVERRRGESRL